MTRCARLDSLDSQYGLRDLLISCLEHHMDLARAAADLNASPQPSNAWPVLDTVKQCAGFLTFAIHNGLQFEWTHVDRLWGCLIDQGPLPTDPEFGWLWFLDVLHTSDVTRLPAVTGALSPHSQHRLLTERVAQLEPTALSMGAYRFVHCLFMWVGLHEQKLRYQQPGEEEAGAGAGAGTDGGTFVTLDLTLTGMPFVWDLVLNTPLEDIATQGMNLIILLYLQPAASTEPAALSEAFLQECTMRLGSAAKLACTSDDPEGTPLGGTQAGRDPSGVPALEEVCGSNGPYAVSPGEGGAKERMSVLPAPEPPGGTAMDSGGQVLGARQAERCMKMLQEFVRKGEGWRVTSPPPHHATFLGRAVPLDVTVMLGGKSTRLHMQSHEHEYLGSLRAHLAAKMGCAAGHVRLLHMGRELLHNGRLLNQLGFLPGQ
ncbi:Ubiquitin carboxyl-terminal hydrolase 24, partial [Cymbomonas tetramitiformis]